jgi:hypothetical protein
MNPLSIQLSVGSAVLLAVQSSASDLDFSDPLKTTPPPAHAIGYPNRASDLNVLPGFQDPPPGYGVVPFYWWLGDPLTKERLGWELDQLAGMGICGLQINYAHSDRGGLTYGLTYPSEPPLFSEQWWELVGWFMREAKKRGAAISLSDYTLGIGQGWCVDEMLRENPGLAGAVLHSETREAAGGELRWELPANTLAVTAYSRDGGPATDLRPLVRDGVLTWPTPAGRYRVIAVYSQTVEPSLDPMNLKSGPEYAKHFFGKFEDHFPGEGGKGLNFFFSDELEFRVQGHLWTGRFADEFRKRKGYDVVPELPALFTDIGPRTPKVRLDYSDVKVALTEEGFFKPVFDWHQQRGMTMGCDHGGRGRDVVEFGDYFRTQRWNQGPGADQPNLGKDLIKAKVASSIAHLYLRPRVWLEGYYGSGWGTTAAGVVDAMFADFVMGYNLLAFHGTYYSTHGGWWEWAPPCNTFHMPYWKHMGGFMECVQRLAFVLSQGHHRCDVAILYPVATMEAGMGGNEAVQTAFQTGERLYGRGIDFDFMDFESLARAKVVGKELHVSGEIYRMLVLPAMKAVRYSTLEKALEFHRAGGVVVAVGALPEASDRAGRDDPQVAAMVKELFPDGPIKDAVMQLPSRDYEGPGIVMHRQLGQRDLYAIYQAPLDAECSFRASGQVEMWDPWTGATRPLPVLSQSAAGTKLRLPLSEKELQLIVFSPGQPQTKKVPRAEPPRATISLEGDWEFELKPSLDNQWGDYHWPPTKSLIGAEARQVAYADETMPNPGWQDPNLDDAHWPRVTVSFGPRFWKLGPLPAEFGDAQLVGLKQVDPATPVEYGGKKYPWQPYAFSWRWGIEGNPGHQGYHGLKENVADGFIGLGAPKPGHNETIFGEEPGGTRYYLWTAVVADRDQTAYPQAGGNLPSAVWLNHDRCEKSASLKAGANPLLLRYDRPGRGSFVLSANPSAAPGEDERVFSPAAYWIWYPDDQGTAADRFFRRAFELGDVSSKGRLRITCDNAYTAYVNGQRIGAGNNWERVQEYDVGPYLKHGANVIAIAAHNDGDAAGLIAVLTPGPVTDATWRCAKSEEEGWRSKDFDDVRWTKAEQVSNFAESLWAKHQMGPPRLDASVAASAPTLEVSPLAMSWYNNPGILQFDPRPEVAKPAGWYRFTAPPGLRRMTIITPGKVRAWANGKELTVVQREAGVNEAARFGEAAAVKVAVRIEQPRGSYGGAALLEPIALHCAPGRITLGDWSQIDGLRSYSGGAWYRKTVTIPAAEQVVLNLGNVVASAEVRVNGKPAGTRVAPPWTVDISDLVNPGENRLEVLVYNTLANHYTTIPTQYRGSTLSGLLGPVQLEMRKP